MCIKRVDAYLDSKGGLHRGEMAALLNEVHIVTGFKPDVIAAVRSTAAALLPLLKRVAELDAPKAAEDAKAAETVDPSSEGPKLTEAELDAECHTKSCMARATGRRYSCNCMDDGSYSGPSVTAPRDPIHD